MLFSPSLPLHSCNASFHTPITGMNAGESMARGAAVATGLGARDLSPLLSTDHLNLHASPDDRATAICPKFLRDHGHSRRRHCLYRMQIRKSYAWACDSSSSERTHEVCLGTDEIHFGLDRVVFLAKAILSAYSTVGL